MSSERSSVLLVLSAPSGGGKTTVMQSLLARRPDLRRVITCTTRMPRGGETQGVDYHFLSAEAFEAKINEGAFLEHATVYGNRYGTLAADVIALLEQGFDVILSVDVQGVESIQEMARRDATLARALVTVFLTPDDPAELERRLRGRAQDAAEVIARRLEVASREVARWRTFDYLVVSGTMDLDAERVNSILAAEKLRASRAGRLTGWPVA